MYKKGVTVMKLRKLLSFVCCLIFIFTFAVSNVYAAASTDKNVIDNYLSEAGFPDDIIEILPSHLKQLYYEKQVLFESSETTYGIMTEEYSIEYTLNEAQQIVIDEENIKEFKKFMKDAEAVKSVEQAKKSFNYGASINIPEPNSKTYTFNENIDTDVSPNDIVWGTNWGGILFTVGIVQSDNLIQKQITYLWMWNYDPWFTLTDHMGIAWSDEFTLRKDSIEYSYTPAFVVGDEVVKEGEPRTTGGKLRHELDRGFGVAFNIVSSFKDKRDGKVQGSNFHGGYLTGIIEKWLKGDDRGQQDLASAKAKNFHQVLMPEGSLIFDKDGPSISITFSTSYDESPETYLDFYYYQ